MSRSRAFAAFLTLCLIVLCLAVSGLGESPKGRSSAHVSVEQSLGELLAPARISVPQNLATIRKQGVQELHLTWESTAGNSAAPSGPRLPSIQSRNRAAGGAARLRSAELGPDKLLVVSVDASGVLRGWAIIHDPRFLRSEGPGADGSLTGEIVQVERAEFLVAVPDDPAAVELRFFQPRWKLKTMVLEQVWAVPLDTEEPNDAQR